MTRRIDVVWGLNGMRSRPAPNIVVIDVLSFSSAVDAACAAGAIIYPFRWRDERVVAFAASVNARVALQRQDARDRDDQVSLSPASLSSLNPGERVVLPSPNGSTLTMESTAAVTIAGCLRNASAVGRKINELDGDVTIVAAGERWADGTLRPALEDLIGAGAILNDAVGTKTEEANAAQAVFNATAHRLEQSLLGSMSGCELTQAGFLRDVQFAADLNASEHVPLLSDGAYRSPS